MQVARRIHVFTANHELALIVAAIIASLIIVNGLAVADFYWHIEISAYSLKTFAVLWDTCHLMLGVIAFLNWRRARLEAKP